MGIRVFHCDDSPVFTALVRFWLEDHPDIEPVGQAHDREQALAAISRARPDIVLVDTLGAPDDPSLVTAVRMAAPHARVITYSGYVRLLAPDTLATGADAYLAKEDDEQALVALIRRLARAG